MLKIINTKKAPKAIGPYNQAIEINNIIMISGQIPLQPIKNLIIDKNISVQVKQTLNNIKSILNDIKLQVHNIIKTTLFILDFEDINDINITYKNFFVKHKATLPARSCIQVTRLPKNSKIEIEAIAYRF